MKFKKILKSTAIVTVATAMLSTNVFALTFKDVDSSYWGYDAISSVSDKGLMVGDLNGNFRPNSFIDRFETSKVLARLLGYKYVGLTEEEQKYYDDCYNEYIPIISQYDDKFSKWDSYSNREIAFLMAEGILTVSDLNQFVILTVDGTESINFLTKEDVAVFLVRILDDVELANSLHYTDLFADDASITSSKKSSVYYLKSIAIINGDNNNNYNPKKAVTRAEMATLLNKTYAYMNDQDNSNTDSNLTTVETITGTITTYYDNLNTISIKETTGETSIYVIDANCDVTIDGYQKSLSDLQDNMYGVFTVENDKTIKSIRVKTTDTNTDNNIDTGTDTNTDTNTDTDTGADYKGVYIYGTVQSVDSANNKISITTKGVSPKGEIIETTSTYSIKPGTQIMEDDHELAVDDIQVDDIITCYVDGAYANDINIEQKEQYLNGVVTEKGVDSTTNRKYFVVLKDGTEQNIRVYMDSDSDIYRDNNVVANWDDIKIGDEVEVETTFGVIDEMYANGTVSYQTGYVREILIKDYNSYIVVSDFDGNNEQKYYLNNNIDGLYNLAVGSKVKLTLDSDEVTDVRVIGENEYDDYDYEVSGTVRKAYTYKLLVETENGDVVDVNFNDNTVFYNNETNEYTNASKVDTGDQISVYYKDDSITRINIVDDSGYSYDYDDSDVFATVEKVYSDKLLVETEDGLRTYVEFDSNTDFYDATENKYTSYDLILQGSEIVVMYQDDNDVAFRIDILGQ